MKTIPISKVKVSDKATANIVLQYSESAAISD